MKFRTAALIGLVLVFLLLSFLSSVSGIPLLTAGEKLPPASSLKAGDVLTHVKVTAYCPCTKCCGPVAVGLTATGRDAWETLGVAVDFKSIPKNCTLEIPGVGQLVADDTGGAMRQDAKKGIYHIDVRFHSHEEAKKWGVQLLEIKIVSITGRQQ